MTAVVIPFSTGVAEAPSAPDIPFLDRDHSILAFDERVLDWARRPDVPLLERLRYLCIVSSNLDEFFELRAHPHLMALQNADHKGEYTVQTFEALRRLRISSSPRNMRFTTTN
jgi:polyphosphate kinase